MSAKEHSLRRKWAVWRRSVLNLGRWVRVLGFCARRFVQDDGPRLAAGLSYASLLALVPLLAIALAILAAFPAFEGVRETLRNAIISGLLPERSAEVNAKFAAFVENAGDLTGPGILALGAAAILLLANIQDAFNKIWRVSEARPLAIRLLTYWALLTLGPLLVGSSLWVSSYAFAAVAWLGAEGWTNWLGVSRLLSMFLAALGLSLIFLVVPNRRVRLSHALAGGATASILLEVLKALFGLYLRNFPSYEAIYGALAAVPIFLIWMFLAWAAVLFGAELTAGLSEWRATVVRGSRHPNPGQRLALAITVIARLRQASESGEQMRERQLAQGLPVTPAEVDEVLTQLRKGGFVERTRGTRWALIRDLRKVTLADLMQALSLELEPGEGWPSRPAAMLDWIHQAIDSSLQRPLEELLAEQETPAAAREPESGKAAQ